MYKISKHIKNKKKKGDRMVYISSVGLGIPPHVLTQEKAKELIKEVFSQNEKKVNRLLPVFDNAHIKERQLATSFEWYKEKQSLQSRNKIYIEKTIQLSLEAMDQCLHNKLLFKVIPYEEIDLITFVSSTGMATPSIDAHLINERPFKESIVRMPLWGLGCGGGAMGISRATDWLKEHPTKMALVVCAELCSLTFQQDDFSTSNIVGTALFGDGVAAVLLMGERSPYKDCLPNANGRLKIEEVNSFIKKDTLNVMGWNVTDNGFEVIFSKKIPRFVKSIWKKHIQSVFRHMNIENSDLHCLVAHPGGRKVLEEMVEVFEGNNDLFLYSYDVLKNHGNMSSATVLYVLKKYMESVYENVFAEDRRWALLSALGPGFCSEIIAMRWTDE